MRTEFQQIVAELVEIKVFPDVFFRVERARKKEVIDIEAIRIYLSEFGKEIDQTAESGENPRLLIKETVRRRTGKPEFEIVFMGSSRERHVEELRYYEKHPHEWRTWGLIVLTPEQAKRLYRVLQKMFGIATLD